MNDIAPVARNAFVNLRISSALLSLIATVVPLCAQPTPSPPPFNPCIKVWISEDFDSSAPPTLPPGWVTSFNPGAANCGPSGSCALGSNWTTSATTPWSAPYGVFHDAPGCVTDSTLDTAPFYFGGPGGQQSGTYTSFAHSFDLEAGRDGAVLEISINGGPFVDFVEAGGVFRAHGYNGTIATDSMSPIAGRGAWTGNSNGYVFTNMDFPQGAVGQTVILRFRLATDCQNAGQGWRVDSIRSEYLVPCSTPTPTPSPGPTPEPSVQAINLSTRVRVQTGDAVGVAGFIISGSTPKHVLVRAIGPSLSDLGVVGALADPVLELQGPSPFVAVTNNNWRDDPAQETAIIASGIAPADNLESAIDVTLDPGLYTAVVRENSDGSGLALVEVYDLSPGLDSKLANLSTRASVSTGDNVVIAGFMLSGEIGDDGITVRGLGPSLTEIGVTNVLADPTLEMRNANGELQAINNDWQDLPGQAAELIAQGLELTNPLEAGLATVLPPGAYTVLLAGKNNETGIGLVEVYDLGEPE